MQEEGFVYELELEFALIWASPPGIACCHLAATRVMGTARPQPETEPGSSRGERYEAEQAVELWLYLPLLPWLRAATRAATQTSLQPAHRSRSALVPAVSFSTQALRTTTTSFLARFPGEEAIKL